MDLYIYTDESGVFDYVHNNVFVFGGVVLFSKEENERENRKYINVENKLRLNTNCLGELKACKISNKEKGKIFRSLNNVSKFGVIVDQSKIHKRIFDDKKSKQRYLDYAYKIMIKKILVNLCKNGKIKLEEIRRINIYCDEHTTATNGKYELREGLIQELKTGTFNYNFGCFYPPICKGLKSLNLNFYDSKNKALIRAGDIVANKIYYSAVKNDYSKIEDKINLIMLP